ncbi:MAG: GNAT family N-acetyltransferase [Thermomicrobiales bacterium]
MTVIRPATTADLDAIWDIRYLNDIAGEAVIPIKGTPPPYLTHLLDHGTLLVAEREGRVIGYAGRVDRGGVAYLTDLFIAPQRQSGAVGSALLRRIFVDDPWPRCTLASTDHRAISLYTRWGMAPLWPNLLLVGERQQLRPLPETDVTMVPADVNDPRLWEKDRIASGRFRPEDLAFFIASERGQPFWFRRGAKTVGYGIVRLGAGRLWWPDAVTVGPLGADSPGDAAACALAAVSWAAAHGSPIEIAVPGPHRALAPLLNAGFRLIYVETACLSAPGLIDPTRYIGSGGDLF